MSTENDDKKIIDPDNLTDEEFMKLEQPPEMAFEPNKEETDANNSSDADQAAANLAAETSSSGDTSTNTEAGDSESGQEGARADGEGGGEEGGGETEAGGDLTDEEKAEAEKAKGVNDDKETLKLKEAEDMTPTDEEQKVAAEKLEQEKAADKESKISKSEVESQELAKIQEDAKIFFEKVSAPFKADGKEIQVRTPEEAIRLMQMGVNYSRRMQEMKPLREMDAMLTAHGLNDPEKLNELIDLSKGSKEAIQKYLKKHNIDPLDLDTSKADAHTTPNYRSDPKDVAFQDAIDTTLQTEGGKELLADVNRDWDPDSKEALRENPSLFGKLLEQKDTGVYEQINKELLHQRTMGYLANVPFLQAYEQVGNAMQKAGVFDENKITEKTGMAPIASGSRKAATKPKTEQPNPNLSSSKTTSVAKAAPQEPDYLSMSDDDFMKLAMPT